MSSKTTNYNLHKIDLTDAPPDITVLNDNWDKIDEELANLQPVSTTFTMVASTWDSLTKQYSFESTYPFASYDLTIQPDGTATDTQQDAWDAARIVALPNTNAVKARGDVPTVDIPILLKVVKK